MFFVFLPELVTLDQPLLAKIDSLWQPANFRYIYIRLDFQRVRAQGSEPNAAATTQSLVKFIFSKLKRANYIGSYTDLIS